MIFTMRNRHFVFLLLICMTVIACSKKEGGPFNYNLVKSKLQLDEAQEVAFDEVVDRYMLQLKDMFQNGKGSQEEKMSKAKNISALQDKEIEGILSEEQFVIYQKEIAIERKGREIHNMSLILEELNLDSTQTDLYKSANEAFYTTLRNNHDFYHGKPDVYLKFYHEIDESRQLVFKEILTEEQYALYQKLADKYKIGQSEH